MRLELPASKKFVREQLAELRWGDMDAMGHVNNTLYFRFMEVIRIDWMRELMLAKALKAKSDGYEVNVNGANM